MGYGRGFRRSLGLVAGPIAQMLWAAGLLGADLQANVQFSWPLWTAPLVAIAGVVLLFASLHGARALGRLHGQLAKHLLVKAG